MKFTKNLQKAAGIVGAATVIVSGYVAFDHTYAKATRLAAVEQRLDQKIVGDRYFETQERLWKMQDRYGKDCEKGDEEVKEQCRGLQKQMKELENELEQIQGGKNK